MNSGPTQSLTKARAYKVAGWIVLIGGILLAISSGLVLLTVVPCYVGYLLLRRAKKYSVGTGDAALKSDVRPPVLYLRSFKDEEVESSPLFRFKNIGASERWLAQTTPGNAIQEQDGLGYLFRKIGPYIALGRPGEELPELGSHKIYVVNDAWQDTVLDFFAKSRLVLFKAGRTEGLKWELAELVRTVDPQKVALILPVSDGDYASFIQWANAILPQKLPPAYPPSRMVTFDAAWKPSYLSQRRTLTESFAPLFEANKIVVTESYWEKVMEQNGLRW
jgi:hypothetical protein